MTSLNPNTRIAIGCYSGDHEQVVQSLDLYLHHECPVVIFSPENAKVQIDHSGIENLHAGSPMLNPGTRVAVCCYAGDQTQVVQSLALYQHHECPVVVLSPRDAKVEIEHPGVVNRFGGEREYIGRKAIARHREHLQILLTFPERFFLIHDADSFCLTPKLPSYLYREPDLVWSNLKINDIPQEQEFFPEGFPHIAFHPPWFLSRNTILALLAAAPSVTPNPNMLFIDYWLVQLAVKARLPWRGFPAAISYPTADPFFAGAAWDAVRHRGTTFVHSVKTPEVASTLMAARDSFVKDHGNEH